MSSTAGAASSSHAHHGVEDVPALQLVNGGEAGKERDVDREDDDRLGTCLAHRPADACIQLGTAGVRRRRRLLELAHAPGQPPIRCGCGRLSSRSSAIAERTKGGATRSVGPRRLAIADGPVVIPIG